MKWTSLSKKYFPTDGVKKKQVVENQILQSIFIKSMQNLEGAAKILCPTLKCLPDNALLFVSHIFGKDDVTPQPAAQAPLANFQPLMQSLKVEELALNHVSKSESYCLCVCYFGGYNEEMDFDKKRFPKQPEIATFLCKFLIHQFQGGNEEKSIRKCVHNAHTLYITAQHDGELHSETIVSCINFALLPDKGFYVNWLATSNESITEEKYGEDFVCICNGGGWKKRHLALFLMQVAHLTVYSHVTALNPALSDYIVALQTRIDGKEKAIDFYNNIGFTEGGIVEGVQDLDKEVYDGFSVCYENAQESTTDYIHIIFSGKGSDNIYMCTNTSGMIGKGLPFGKQIKPNFDQLTKNADCTYFRFPFCIKRQNLMLLAAGLDFFFLPFSDDADMNGFIHPSEQVGHNCIAHVTLKDIQKMEKIDSWLTDVQIDFYIRW